MSRLAFSNKGRYADYSKGYELYSKRSKREHPVDIITYHKIVDEYCKSLAERFERDGMADFPNGLGTLFTASFRKKPQYRGKKFIGIGKVDWNTGEYDGSHESFGILFLPRRNRTACLRCFGFVANRRLFQRMKKAYMEQVCDWKLMSFNEDMI